MKILVTGGAGFIGKYIVKSLLKNNTVTIYDNLESSSKKSIEPLISSGASFIKGDILDFELLKKSSVEHDIVIHLAAKSDVVESTLHPEITENVNVNGTKNVLKCCIENKIKKIIFASSAAVYGNSVKIPINEKTKIEPISPYGKSKLSAETILKKICEENNLKYIIFRMFNVYGKGQNENFSGVITKFLRNIANDKPIIIYGDGKQTRDFVSIYDVVKAFEIAVNSERTGTYNIIASGEYISINELSKILSSTLNKKLKIKHVEKQKDDIQNSQADITLAENELGFRPTISLKEELSSIYHELD
jgi:UDP-glucose 4-epimerase